MVEYPRPGDSRIPRAANDKQRRLSPEDHPEAFVRQLVEVYQSFQSMATLAPGEEMDRLFAELMRLCVDRPGVPVATILGNPRVAAILPDLRRICASAEYHRELAWARRALASTEPETTMSEVPFAANYQELVRFEIHGVRGAGNADPRTVLMAGAGPIPFSALLYARTLGARVDSVDVDAEAIACARLFYRAFDAVRGGRVHHSDILDFTELDGYDLVILGASVGLTRPDRLKVVEHLARHMRQGAVLLVRTAHGMRRLLFPQIDPEDLTGFTPQLLCRPFAGVINSALIAVKAEAET